MDAALGMLLQGGGVCSTRRASFLPAEYTFKHALTDDVAYQSLVEERRRLLHRRVAAAMETRYGEGRADLAGALASHFERGEDWSKAATYCAIAAGRARECHAYPDAVRLAMLTVGAADAAGDASGRRVDALGALEAT